MSYMQKVKREIILPDKRKSIYFAHPEKKWKTKREKMIIKLLTEREYNVINPFTKEEKKRSKVLSWRYNYYKMDTA